VASESTFNTSGGTLSPARISLNDESMEALICAQDWLRVSITGMFYLYYYCSYYCTEIKYYDLLLCLFVDFGGQVGDPLWCDQANDSICGSGA
jgi:hAT family C-terminal dimerisation region